MMLIEISFERFWFLSNINSRKSIATHVRPNFMWGITTGVVMRQSKYWNCTWQQTDRQSNAL